MKRKMLSMKRSTSLPSSSRKYSATVRPVRATRRRAPGRLGHLAVDEGGLGLARVLDVDDARLLELQPEVVALARALAHAREHGHAAVLLGEVVDQLLDDDGLAHAGAAEQADLAAAQVGLDEVDDLDAGLEHLELGGLLLEGGRGAVDRVALLGLDRAQLVHRLADHVQHAAERGRAHRHRDGAARCRSPSCRAPCRRWAAC